MRQTYATEGLTVRRLRTWSLPVVLALTAVAAASLAGRSRLSGAALLSGRLALHHIEYLASDRLGGRGNGTPGLDEASRYIAERFHEYRLRAVGDDGSYFQHFMLSLEGQLGPKNFLRLRGAAGFQRELELHRDYEPMSFSASGQVSAALVFAGYGITAPEKGYDDYEKVDVRGKAVLILRHHPQERLEHGPFEPRPHATFTRKATNALAHGAVALLVVNDPLPHQDEKDQIVSFGADLGADEMGIPVVFLKRDVVEKLFAARARELAGVQAAIDARLEPASFELPGVSIDLSVDIERARRAARNVLAYLPPRGGNGREELLVIGAHFDHLGLGESRSGRSRGEIHNGADDNASGTAGLLELGRVFAMRQESLHRGILFAAFAGEELGLIGSSRYVSEPPLPLERTVAMINLDMIGRLRDTLYIGGAGSSALFQAKLDELAKPEGVDLSFAFSGYGSTDHTSFNEKGVPALFFFTGLHSDYHKPSDDSERIDAAGMTRVLRLAYGIADYLQAVPERPIFIREARQTEGGSNDE